MHDPNFAVTISKLAQEVFRQPSLIYNHALVFREIPGFDSILAIKYILSVETAFEVTLNEEEVDNMRTMGDLLAILQTKKT